MLPPRVTVFDFEMPNSHYNAVSSVGLTVIENGKLTQTFYSLVDPQCPFDPFTVNLTGISAETVQGAPTFAALWETLRPFFENTVLCAHAAPGDLHVLSTVLRRYHIHWVPQVQYLCTLELAKQFYPDSERYSLDFLAAKHGIQLTHHVSLSDAEAAAQLLLRFAERTETLEPFIKVFDMDTGHPYRETDRERMMNNICSRLQAQRDPVFAKARRKQLGTDAVLGVRPKEIRRIAVSISERTDAQFFLEDLPHKWAEEDILHAYLLNRKKRFRTALNGVNRFLPYITNDEVLSILSPGVLAVNRPALLEAIDRWLTDPAPYAPALALRLLGRFFTDRHRLSPEIADRVLHADRSLPAAEAAAVYFFSRAFDAAPEAAEAYAEALEPQPDCLARGRAIARKHNEEAAKAQE